VLGTIYRTSSRDCGKRIAQCLRYGSTDSQKCISSSVLVGAIICSQERAANLLVNLRSKVQRKPIRAFHLLNFFGRLLKKTGKLLVREHRQRPLWDGQPKSGSVVIIDQPHTAACGVGIKYERSGGACGYQTGQSRLVISRNDFY